MTEQSGGTNTPFEYITPRGLSFLLSTLTTGMIEACTEIHDTCARDVPTEILREVVLSSLDQTFDEARDYFDETDEERQVLLGFLSLYLNTLHDHLFPP